MAVVKINAGLLGFQLLRPVAQGANLLEFEVVMDVRPSA